MNALRNVFAEPRVLYLLMAFPILTLIQLIFAWHRRRLLGRIGTPRALFSLMPPKPRFRWLTSFAIATAFSLLIAGAAAPHWGHDARPEVVAGRDIVILLDMSGSMRATDAPPNRFERARESLMELADAIRQRGGHRLGLVVFASDAQVVVPLTYDYDHFREKLADLDMDHLPPGLAPKADTKSGTRIGIGLKTAVAAHFALDAISPQISAPDPAMRGFQDVILLSDGDDPVDDAEWRDGLNAIAKWEIPVSAIGIGDPDSDAKVPGHFDAVTRLRDKPLREIARMTGGHYLDARTSPVRLTEFFRHRIESKGGTALEGDPLTLPNPRQSWFYGGALALFAIGWLNRAL
jgi:Ca-activated chloride channel family protein